MPIDPVILRQWILGGIVVAGLLFSGKPAALPVDEADLLNRHRCLFREPETGETVAKDRHCTDDSKAN